ncbi:MAG TPA: ABC transporter permease [Steroidobacteraceae bacterium]|nr:ABC transporter permease [Steroidobacteraceae bacterium]
MITLMQDLKFAVRMLAKSPAFAAVAVLTLALAIGANTALFSIVNGVLLNPLPYPQPDQLITLHESKPNFNTGSISYPNFLDWQEDNRTLSAMAVSRSYSFSLTGFGPAEQAQAQLVTPDFFPILGVKPVTGRTFVRPDDQIGAAPVALISAGFWKRKFGSAPDVVGKSLTLDGMHYTIIGVIPADFDLMVDSFSASEIYVPVVQWNNNLLFNRGAGLGFHGIGRLKPGVTVGQARADFAAITQNLADTYPEVNRGIGAALIPFRQRMLGDVQPILLVLFCAVAFVLLIACANIANLLLARSTARMREFAVRAALGAGKSRLIRQLLTESILLGVVGGALGLLLASWGMRAALNALPATLPRAGEIHIDLRVLLFTTAATLLAGILFGLVPALKISRTNLQDSLKEGGRGSSGSRQRAHGILVIVEMSLALVLLIGAGLALRTLVQLWNVDPGFNPRNVLTFGFSLSPAALQSSPAAIRASFRAAEAAVASTPGVQSVSMSWGAFPMSGDDEWLFWCDGQPKPTTRNEMNWVIDYVVDPDYLNIMQTPLRTGRFFTARDDEMSPPVVVIDDVFARQYFAHEDPVGKRLFLEIGQGNSQAEIIGVVAHVNQWGLDTDGTERLRAQLYFPFMQLPDPIVALAPIGMRMVARTRGPDAGAFDSIRHSVQQVNGEQVVYGAQTMSEVISDSTANRRFSAILLGAFAAVALLLSAVGIYGVISYLIGQRTHEIGIRMALGAQQGKVLFQVLREGLKLAVTGAAIGLAAAFALTRLMTSLLYGVSPTDPLTFAAVAVLLVAVALASCYIPARRAAAVDPMVALRHE